MWTISSSKPIAIAPPMTSASPTVSARPVSVVASKRLRISRRSGGCSWTVSVIVVGATAGAETFGQRCASAAPTNAPIAPAAIVTKITMTQVSPA